MNEDFLQIFGVIGVGKSTLLSAFPRDTWEIVSEPVKRNRWLPIFYAELNLRIELLKVGIKGQSVSIPMMEVSLVAKRKLAIERAKRFGKPVVSDFGLPRVFARMLHKDGFLSDFDFETFLEVDEACFVKPRYVIYLDGLESAYANMQRRGRKEEKGVTFEYNKRLREEYMMELDALSEMGAVVEVIEWNNGGDLDAVENFLLRYKFPPILDRENYRKVLELGEAPELTESVL